MTDPTHLVTILIATKDRASELQLTLREMRKQEYPSTELLVVDDGSANPVGPVVLENWPGATVVRHDKSVGQCARRNEGFQRSNGKYILQLDDDCSLLGPSDLAKAVDTLERNPQAGAVTFYIVNSLILPEKIDNSQLPGGCVSSFVGAAVLFRKAALDRTTGYRSFFGNEWEEEELGLQLLSDGWEIVFVPQLIAHHRLSALNRNSARTWMRGLRNRIWAMYIHMPFPRVIAEIGWKVTLGAWDAIRLLRGGLFFKGLFQAATGLPAIWNLRNPLSRVALRRYDLLRVESVITAEQFARPGAAEWSDLGKFWGRWRNRARNRSAWDSRSNDVGTSATVLYAHETEAASSPGEKKSA